MVNDSEWRRSVDNRLDALLEQQASFDARLGRMETNMANLATKSELSDLARAISEIAKSMTHYAAHVEHLLNGFAASHESLESRFNTLERRVAELEKRIPPQQAA